ncbi:hypothetical protein [Caproicibacter fermentans]|nr:hypothetical protein [Caproicibacter fermentans]
MILSNQKGEAGKPSEEIAFRENDISEERIIQAGVDALMAYLFL